MRASRRPALRRTAPETARRSLGAMLTSLAVERNRPFGVCPSGRLGGAPSVQVAEQADLRAVMDDLQVRVQDQSRHGGLGELGRLRRTLLAAQPRGAEPAYTLDPPAMLVVKLSQSILGGTREAEGGDSRGP